MEPVFWLGFALCCVVGLGLAAWFGWRAGDHMEDSDPSAYLALFLAAPLIGSVGLISHEGSPFMQLVFGAVAVFMLALCVSRVRRGFARN